jgi:hypothetical protein
MAAGRLSFALAEVIDQHGLFCELDTDRGSHCCHTPKAGEAVSKTWFSWFGVDPSPGTRTAGTHGTVYATIGLSQTRWVLGIACPTEIGRAVIGSPVPTSVNCRADWARRLSRSEWSFVMTLGLMHSGRQGLWLSSASSAGFQISRVSS